MAADEISVGDSQWGLWKYIRNTEAGVWRMSGSYPGGREGSKFLREESALWAQEAEGSLYDMVTEQKRVQKTCPRINIKMCFNIRIKEENSNAL